MVTDGLTPFGVLAFLGVILACLGAGAVCIVALARRERDFAKLVAKSTLGGVAAYAVLLLTASFTSRDRTLALNQEKHLCEVDCHLAYSVVGEKTAQTLGTDPDRKTARGAFYIVTVKVRFDERTISSHRGMAPLTPNGRTVAVVDGRGRRYPSSPAGLTRPLIPGQSYTTDLIFDLPTDATDLRLVLAGADLETRLIIGHENSFFHGKTTFRLSA